jgi:Tol biopolymer transport system component
LAFIEELKGKECSTMRKLLGFVSGCLLLGLLPGALMVPVHSQIQGDEWLPLLAASEEGSSPAATQGMGITTRVSKASDGTQGNNESRSPSVSADGRYVAFESYATNLVSDDTNSTLDVFVHDRQTGQTERVSIATDGTQGNDRSGSPRISATGRYVAFVSRAGNLVAGDSNGRYHIFVHDRQTGHTERVSVASDGTLGNGDSGGSLGESAPAISADGRYVAFDSHATNLVGDDTNGCIDVFLHDRQTDQTERVSVSSEGAQGTGLPCWSEMPSMSSDGRYVAFMSGAANMVSGDTNGGLDVFVRDRQTGQTTRVSVASDGTEGIGSATRPAVSADGRYVAFQSTAGNLVGGDSNNQEDIFVHDRQTGHTERVSVATDGSESDRLSWEPSISADGRYVAFFSEATNLVGDHTGGRQIFGHARLTGWTERISVNSDGQLGSGSSYGPSVSDGGRYVAFWSYSWLVSDDSNGYPDVFVRDRSQGSSVVLPSGGYLTSADESLSLEFPAGAVEQPTVVTYSQVDPLPTGDLLGVRFFDLSAVIQGTTTPVTSFDEPYTATIYYTDAERGTAIESSLRLYWQDGDQWLPEPTSHVSSAENRLTATPSHMTLFAVLGETDRVYLPVVMRDG